MRAIGLDVHLYFCEVAISEDGAVRSAGRIEATPEQIELFARSLGAGDRVALEVTGNAWEITLSRFKTIAGGASMKACWRQRDPAVDCLRAGPLEA
jgi:hypothetical protein